MPPAKPHWDQPLLSHIPRSLNIETSETETKQPQFHIHNGNAARKTGKHHSNTAAVQQKGFAWLTPAPRAGLWTTNTCSSLALFWGRNAFSSCDLIPAHRLWGDAILRQGVSVCITADPETSLSTCPVFKTLGKLVRHMAKLFALTAEPDYGDSALL